MSQEIVDAVRALAREKGISEDKLVHALEDALLSAYKKQPGAARYARVRLDPDEGEYRVEELLLPEDLEDWEDTLATLESGRFAMWLTSGRTPSMKFKPDESGGLWVSVHDGPSSGVTVTLPLFAPPQKWVIEQRDLLAQAREAYPREVVETSPGAYEWRRARNV